MLKKFFSIAACCALFASSAAAAQQANEVEMGNAIRKGVDQRVDQRVDDRLKQFEQRQAAVTEKAGSYADKSARYNVYLANCASGGMTPSLRDEAARKFDAMSETEFRKQLDHCPRAVQDRKDTAQVQLAQTRINADVDVNIGGRPGYGYPAYGRTPAYRSFDNVAADSLRVRSHGKNFDLRNIGGNTQACHPPRQLVRSNRCGPTPDGRGVRCQFDCR